MNDIYHLNRVPILNNLNAFYIIIIWFSDKNSSSDEFICLLQSFIYRSD